MNVSIYIIGTELTRGIITDKHTQVISQEVTKLGYKVNRSVIVPDDGSIRTSLYPGLQDSDVIIVTGGLGPTSDDMTRDIIASVAGVELKQDKQAWDTLYAKVGKRIYGANERQTYIPEGFIAIPNGCGTACGFRGSFKYEGKCIELISMPGPPVEMQPMFYGSVLPFLSDLIGCEKICCDEYSVFLIAEAKLEELCKQIEIEGVSWGTRFQAMRISLYISGKDSSLRKSFIKDLRKLVGEDLIADGNVEAVELLTSFLKKNGATISCAESCTCGLLAKTLTDLAGSSAWFQGGACTYSLEAKRKMLSVSKEIEDPVTAQCAKEMAEGILEVLDSDFAVSVTGYAGPASPNDTAEVGTVFFGFASKNSFTQVVGLKMFVSNRDSARRKFTVAALLLANLYARGFNLIDIADKWLYI